MKENEIGTAIVDCAVLLNFGEALIREGITRTINGSLESDPPCLGASVREQFIEPNAASPRASADR